MMLARANNTLAALVSIVNKAIIDGLTDISRKIMQEACIYLFSISVIIA